MLIERPTLRAIRRKLPGPLRYGAQLLYGMIPTKIHHGPEYRIWRKRIEQSELWSADEHREAQGFQLEALLEHCFVHVPHYRELANREGLTASLFRDPAEIRRLPLLSKEEIRDHLDSFVAESYPRRLLHYATTGGSTGIPLGFYNSPEVISREAAFVASIWEEQGYRPWKDRCAVLRGVFVEGPRGEFWSYNPFRKELHISSYALTLANAAKYVACARSWGTRFLQAYPSAATLLAQYLDGREIARGLFKAIFTASENLYPDQRGLLERVFQCPVVDFYGMSEHAAMARPCGSSARYHFFPQYGIVEFLDSQGNPVSRAGELAEIVATGFLNWATPMVRYRTGDLVMVAEGSCPCGRRYPLVERIEGRLQELLITPDGRHISMTAINMHNDLFDHVYQFQFEQTEPESVLLRLVPKKNYTEADGARIAAVIGEKIGQSVQLRIQIVSHIEPGPGGKHRFLIQRIPGTARELRAMQGIQV